MGQKRTPGLFRRGKVWHIDKEVLGGRICQSTGTSDRQEAERFLAHQLEEVRQAAIYGVRPRRTFREAEIKYLDTHLSKRAIDRDAQDLRLVDPYLGELELSRIHQGTLEAFIADRLKSGVAVGTVNRTLAIVRRILNLAATLWRDEFGLTWLQTAPMIQLLKDTEKRKPYPMEWAEEALLGSKLPPHLRLMTRFAINTGCREQEICKLRWDWEVVLPEIGASVFVIPAEVAKNGEDRVIVLNRFARRAIDRSRGKHPEYVFSYKGSPVTKIYNSAWKRARRDAAASYPRRMQRDCPKGYAEIRVHDTRHTFGQRLRAKGVSLEDRQDLLGHKSGRMTTHYSSAEIKQLINAVERVCAMGSRKSPAVSVLRVKDLARDSSKIPLKTSQKDGGDGWNRTSDLSIMSAAL